MFTLIFIQIYSSYFFNAWIANYQVATKQLFLEGFAKVKKENLEVTDDVSVIEALGKPVKLTRGKRRFVTHVQFLRL